MTPIAEHVHAYLAKHFKLTGGNIKHIAVGAVFLVAEDGTAASMSHLLRSTLREHQKLSKLLSEQELLGFEGIPVQALESNQRALRAKSGVWPGRVEPGDAACPSDRQIALAPAQSGAAQICTIRGDILTCAVGAGAITPPDRRRRT